MFEMRLNHSSNGWVLRHEDTTILIKDHTLHIQQPISINRTMAQLIPKMIQDKITQQSMEIWALRFLFEAELLEEAFLPPFYKDTFLTIQTASEKIRQTRHGTWKKGHKTIDHPNALSPPQTTSWRRVHTIHLHVINGILIVHVRTVKKDQEGDRQYFSYQVHPNEVLSFRGRHHYHVKLEATQPVLYFQS